MSSRRRFLQQLLTLGTGIAVVGPEVLEQLVHKKIWALGGLPERAIPVFSGYYEAELTYGSHYDLINAVLRQNFDPEIRALSTQALSLQERIDRRIGFTTAQLSRETSNSPRSLFST